MNKQVAEYGWLIVVRINCGLNPDVGEGPIVFSEHEGGFPTEAAGS
jgi:hypothetical protein